MSDPKDDKSLADDTHHESGAPTDDAHAAVGDGTLQGSQPAGELGQSAEDGETSEPGTG
ncbi:hypothetical protein LQ953_15675 [Sphingomonas sp. IC-56]|uniref:hypothetical protein n=1 Tax=Sphingomonas sp. IC-56 TaxID=2898529 RepID=UPI001E4E0B95|nr:hypothetical protein [Sphingomonas sp. IC-56]MCD2325458.1 hypothetical protein [Sphingomonas sp. IC-56]